MLVNNNGQLISVEQFNQSVKERTNLNVQYQYTDLHTFNLVTKDKAANVDYAKMFPLNTNSKIWVFDLYQTSFIINSESRERVNFIFGFGGRAYETFVLPGKNWLIASVGDVFINPSQFINYESHGFSRHCAGSLWNVWEAKNFEDYTKKVGTVEVQGSRILGGYAQWDQVAMLSLEHYCKDEQATMFALTLKCSNSQAGELAAFWASQALGGSVK